MRAIVIIYSMEEERRGGGGDEERECSVRFHSTYETSLVSIINPIILC